MVVYEEWEDLGVYPSDIKVSEVDAIATSVHNIMSVTKGEMVFNPEFGIDIDDYVFQPIDGITEYQMMSEIRNAIERWEPRVRVDTIRSSIESFPDQYMFKINLVVEVLGYDDEMFEFNLDHHTSKR